MKNSKLFQLKLSDFWKGFIVTVFAAIANIIIKSLENNTFSINWNLLAITTLSTAIGYLSKNLFSNSKGEPFKPEVKNEEPLN